MIYANWNYFWSKLQTIQNIIYYHLAVVCAYCAFTNSVLCTNVSAFRELLDIKAFGNDLWQHITIKRFSHLAKYFPFVSHFYFVLCFHSIRTFHSFTYECYGFRFGYAFDSFSSLKSFSCFHFIRHIMEFHIPSFAILY